MKAPNVKDRVGRIGSSSWGDILNAESWNCARRLAYSVVGFERDYDEVVSSAMERGNRLEPVCCEMLEEQRGVKVDRTPDLTPEDWLPEWWSGVPDGKITDVGPLHDGPIAVELKTVNVNRFRAFMDTGVPLAWRCQTLFHMPLLGAKCGILGLLRIDPWTFIPVDIERDDALLDKMRRAGERFMERLARHELPPQIEDFEDPTAPCGDCCWRQTCLGAKRAERAEAAQQRINGRGELAVIERHDGLASSLAIRDAAHGAKTKAEADIKDAQAAIDGILAGLGHPDGVVMAGRKVSHLESLGGERFDLRAFRAKHPDIAAEFAIPGKPGRRWYFGKNTSEAERHS